VSNLRDVSWLVTVCCLVCCCQTLQPDTDAAHPVETTWKWSTVTHHLY